MVDFARAWKVDKGGRRWSLRNQKFVSGGLFVIMMTVVVGLEHLRPGREVVKRRKWSKSCLPVRKKMKKKATDGWMAMMDIRCAWPSSLSRV